MSNIDFTNIPVIIEIPKGDNIKYEIDSETGLLKVNRILHTSMIYPINYGYFPNTMSEDNDPLDAMVLCSGSLRPYCLINTKPIACLNIEDQSGIDNKVLCIPTIQTDPFYSNINNINDLPENLIKEIEHFFQHYKDLEPNKWVKIHGWENLDYTKKLIEKSIKKYNDIKD